MPRPIITPEDLRRAVDNPDIRIDLIDSPVFCAHCHTCGWLGENRLLRATANADAVQHAHVSHP